MVFTPFDVRESEYINELIVEIMKNELTFNKELDDLIEKGVFFKIDFLN